MAMLEMNPRCILLKLFLVCINIRSFLNLENGLARTPPMGWLAWERFHCNTDCVRDPENCISENLFVKMAEQLIKGGYRDAGYKYVNIDDCWMSSFRDTSGNMVADPHRFPHGIKFLADYMHENGLMLGIYQDFGHHTCMGYPGIIGHMKEDAYAFKDWNVDMVKLDGCHSHPLDLDEGYIEFGNLLNGTGRHMLYSCSWPYYQLISHMEPNYNLISSHCNMWRNFHDIEDSWKSINLIIDFFGDNQEVLSVITGPGRWADPDMLVIGNFHLTPGQARIHMAAWCIFPGPLLMSNDLRSIDPIFKEILLNGKAISINQDKLGLPGKRIYKKHSFEVWVRPISPQFDGKFSYAVLFINKDETKNKKLHSSLNEFGFENSERYSITDVFGYIDYGIHYSNVSFNVVVPAMDAVLLHCIYLNK